MPAKNDLLVLTFSLLAGLTILVPIPFLDDWLKSQAQRRMVVLTLQKYGYNASAEEIKQLIPADDPGCLRGCILGGMFYLLKKLVRQLIPILEWSRAMDTVSQTYYHGYLVDYALQHGRYQPGGSSPGSLRRAARINFAIRQARSTVQTRMISQAIRQVLGHSRKTVLETARWLGKELNHRIFHRLRAVLRGLWQGFTQRMPKRWRRRSNQSSQPEPEEDKIEEIIEKAPAQQRRAFDQLLTDLQQAIASSSEQPLRLLEDRFEQALAAPPLHLAD